LFGVLVLVIVLVLVLVLVLVVVVDWEIRAIFQGCGGINGERTNQAPGVPLVLLT
jgi:hypothetical protein